ncbi:MAG: hypothetical protein M3Y57_01590 [Acidobacteriota bacterium]|nr:hypothetical protein [Acidobacteriota bacterium]
MFNVISRIFGAVLVADGICAMVEPTTYSRRLEIGTPIIDDLLEFCAENPDITRGFSVLEIALGAWLTLR